MKTKTMLAALLASFAAAVAPAVALADDTTAVKADVAQLASDVKTAHDVLIADLGAVTTDAQKGDKAATRADVKKFRSDRASAFAKIKADRDQLKTDLKAARATKLDPSGLKPVIRAAVASNRAALSDVRQAADQARAALKALVASSRK